jgi:SNF2 family DNA or RNA helicase
VGLAVGNSRERLGAINSRRDVVVMNYETAARYLDDLRLLCRRSRVALVVDESFNVKNAEAQRTAALIELREWCVRAYVLCGSPAPNSALDVMSQFNLVDFGYTFDGLRLDDGLDVATEQIRAAVRARGLYVRNLKREVLATLPPKTYTEVRLDLSPRQGALYRQLARDLVRDLSVVSDEEFLRDFTSFFARRSALLRVSSNPTPLVDGYDEVPAKLRALDDLVPHYVRRGEKVVIWSYYRASLATIAERYASFGAVRLDGGVADVAERREAVRRFQEDDGTMLFVGNPAAAGAGLTLHRARIAVYESFSNQAAHYLQSLDRIHRRGQDRPVEYVVLLCRDTLDEVEYARLLEKADAQSDLLGDPQDLRPTRESMLSEILRAQGGPDGTH